MPARSTCLRDETNSGKGDYLREQQNCAVRETFPLLEKNTS